MSALKLDAAARHLKKNLIDSLAPCLIIFILFQFMDTLCPADKKDIKLFQGGEKIGFEDRSV